MSGSNGDAPWMQGVSAANQARSLYGYGAKAYPWVSSQVSGAANSLGSAAPAASAAETGASAAGTAEAGAGAAEAGAGAAEAGTGIGSYLALLGETVGAMFSDARMKTDIRPVGLLDNGLPIYAYRFKSGGPTQIGLLAQDVAKAMPQAVGHHGGLLTVNYDLATEGGR